MAVNHQSNHQLGGIFRNSLVTGLFALLVFFASCSIPFDQSDHLLRPGRIDPSGQRDASFKGPDTWDEFLFLAGGFLGNPGVGATSSLQFFGFLCRFPFGGGFPFNVYQTNCAHDISAVSQLRPRGVVGFTLDSSIGEYVLTRPNITPRPQPVARGAAVAPMFSWAWEGGGGYAELVYKRAARKKKVPPWT